MGVVIRTGLLCKWFFLQARNATCSLIPALLACDGSRVLLAPARKSLETEPNRAEAQIDSLAGRDRGRKPPMKVENLLETFPIFGSQA